MEIMFIGECETIRAAHRTLETHAHSDEYTLALTEYEERGMSMLDVLQRGVTKGTALAEWARRRGIAPHEVMAIGDNWNDREMLEYRRNAHRDGQCRSRVEIARLAGYPLERRLRRGSRHSILCAQWQRSELKEKGE